MRLRVVGVAILGVVLLGGMGMTCRRRVRVVRMEASDYSHVVRGSDSVVASNDIWRCIGHGDGWVAFGRGQDVIFISGGTEWGFVRMVRSDATGCRVSVRGVERVVRAGDELEL